MRYCAHEKPQLFFSVVIGVAGPVFAILGTPLRRSLLFDDAPPIPVTYPCKYTTVFFPEYQISCSVRGISTLGNFLFWHCELTDVFCIVPNRPREQLTGFDDE